MFFQRKFSNCLAVLIHNGHAPVREIRSIHKHAICPKLAGDLSRAFAGGLHIREIKLVFRKSGGIIHSTLYFGMMISNAAIAGGAV